MDANFFYSGVWLVVGVATLLLLYFSGIVRYIPNTRVGVVEKLWSLGGSVRSGFIALNADGISA